MSASPSPSAATGSHGAAVRRLLALAALVEAPVPRLGRETLAAVDIVAARLLPLCPPAGRAAFAERTAAFPVPLPETLGRLSLDLIAVARPVLARSPVLDDQDLIAAALEGAAHAEAIAGRARLSTAVTDILVACGSPSVLAAVAANGGARLSPATAAELVERSGADAALRDTLRRRDGLPDGPRRRLAAIDREEARARLRLAFADPATAPPPALFAALQQRAAAVSPGCGAA